MPEKTTEIPTKQPKDQIDLGKWIGSLGQREMFVGSVAAFEALLRDQKVGPEMRALVFGAAVIANEAMKAKEQGVDFRDPQERGKFIRQELVDITNYLWFSIALALSVPESLPIIGKVLEVGGNVVEAGGNVLNEHPQIGEAIKNAFLGVTALGVAVGTTVLAQKEIWAKNLKPAIDTTRKKSSDFFTAVKEGRVEWQPFIKLQNPVKEIHPPPTVEPAPLNPHVPKRSFRDRN